MGHCTRHRGCHVPRKLGAIRAPCRAHQKRPDAARGSSTTRGRIQGGSRDHAHDHDCRCGTRACVEDLAVRRPRKISGGGKRVISLNLVVNEAPASTRLVVTANSGLPNQSRKRWGSTGRLPIPRRPHPRRTAIAPTPGPVARRRSRGPGYRRPTDHVSWWRPNCLLSCTRRASGEDGGSKLHERPHAARKLVSTRIDGMDVRRRRLVILHYLPQAAAAKVLRYVPFGAQKDFRGHPTPS